MRFAALALVLVTAAACTPPAAAQRSPQADSPAALPHARQFKMHSASLNRDFEIYVAEPSGLDAGEKAAALYSLDGDTTFGMVAQIARRLQGAGEMVPAYVVAVGYGDGPNQRDHDYVHETLEDVPGSGGGAGFERFLLDELKPLVEARYPVDRTRSVLAGHSFGGLFVANVLVRHPQAFSGWLISSGSLWAKDEAVVKAAAALPRTGGGGGRVFLSVGEQEGPIMIDPMQRFADALRDKAPGLSVSRQVWSGETHASVAPIAYSRGLRFLLAGPHYGEAEPAGD